MPNTAGGTTPQPPSLEKRLPIALALMMLVLLASQYFFKPAPGPKPAKPVDDKIASQVTTKPTTGATAQAAASEAPATGQIGASKEITAEIDTAVYHIVFTNRGAAVKSWVLKDYKDTSGKPLQLINEQAFSSQSGAHIPLPFSIEAKDRKLSVDPDAVLYQQKISPDGTSIEYEYSDGKTTIRKSFQFSKNSYLSEVRSTVREGSSLVPHYLLWRGGFGDPKAFRAASTENTIRYDASAGKLITKTVKDAKNGPITDSGNYTFAGQQDNFFAEVALPRDGSSLEIRTFSDDIKVPGEEKPVQYVGTGISTGEQNEMSLFVGPKDIEILKSVNPKLTQIIDWGFFGILAKPIFAWLNWTKEHWTNNYGWGIVVVTLIINIALFPLRLTSLKSARKMQRLQPQIKAINDRYKNVKLNDPRKAEQNQEVMALYKQEGVNPVGGCLPMLIQMPFLYAFYRVLSIAIELRHAPWLWVTDLSAPETLPIHLLPIILVVTQFMTQKMTPAAGVDPNQQRMMLFMPIMFGFMFYSLSSGLVLYYLTSNLVGVTQQLIINRFMPTAPAPAVSPAKAPVKKTSKK
ncbi:MAG: protein translocase subunit yidC [Bryobacterales bacterium]|nr:protein translocase subunit yidC [Bryobacterales bacterium]